MYENVFVPIELCEGGIVGVISWWHGHDVHVFGTLLVACVASGVQQLSPIFQVTRLAAAFSTARYAQISRTNGSNSPMEVGLYTPKPKPNELFRWNFHSLPSFLLGIPVCLWKSDKRKMREMGRTYYKARDHCNGHHGILMDFQFFSKPDTYFQYTPEV